MRATALLCATLLGAASAAPDLKLVRRKDLARRQEPTTTPAATATPVASPSTTITDTLNSQASGIVLTTPSSAASASSIASAASSSIAAPPAANPSPGSQGGTLPDTANTGNGTGSTLPTTGSTLPPGGQPANSPAPSLLPFLAVAQWTNTTGIGACGTSYGLSDSVVAVNSAIYGDTNSISPLCGMQIWINDAQGHSVQATIQDVCDGPRCGDTHGIVLTKGLFTQLGGNLDRGIYGCVWGFSSGSNENSASTASDPSAASGAGDKTRGKPGKLSPIDTRHSRAPSVYCSALLYILQIDEIPSASTSSHAPLNPQLCYLAHDGGTQEARPQAKRLREDPSFRPLMAQSRESRPDFGDRRRMTSAEMPLRLPAGPRDFSPRVSEGSSQLHDSTGGQHDLRGSHTWRAAPAPLDLAARKLARSSNSDLKIDTNGSTTSEAAAFANRGLGLGLPFSATVGSGLSSFAVASSQERATSMVAPPSQSRTRRSPATQSSSGASAPSSPEIDRDRSKLIGLGELATPRWTAAIHERRWGEHAVPEPLHEWEADVLNGYANAGESYGVESPTQQRAMPKRPLHRRQPSHGSQRSPLIGTSPDTSGTSSNMSAIDQLLGVLSAEAGSSDPLSPSVPSRASESRTEADLSGPTSPALSAGKSAEPSPRSSKRQSAASSRKALGVEASGKPEISPRRPRTTSGESKVKRRSSLQAAARRSSPPPAHTPSPPPPLPSASTSAAHRKSGSAAHFANASPRDSLSALPPHVVSQGLVKQAHAQGHDSIHPESDEVAADALRRLDGLQHAHSPRVAQQSQPTSPVLPASATVTQRRSMGGASASSSRRASQALGHPSSDGVSTRRTSSSSAFSAAGARDSSSITSVSRNNSSMRAVRRTSASSDASSLHGVHAAAASGSGGEDAVSRGNESPIPEDDTIPPVPPLPSNWEAFKGYPSSTELLTPRQTVGDESLGGPPSPSMTVATSAPTGKAIPRTKKWSISHALGLGKSGIKGSSSFNDLVFPSDLQLEEGSLAGGRKSISEHSLSGIASGSRKPRLSVATRVDAGSQPSSLSSAGPSTGQSAPMTTTSSSGSSPAVSRASIGSARRTPSGIPFFARKSSSTSLERDDEPLPSPSISVDETEEKEKTGRKSILGITFSRRKSAVATEIVGSKTPQAAPRATPRASERAPAIERALSEDPNRTPSKSLLGRKRGKTLPTGDSPVQADSPRLPPALVHALPPSTAQAVDSLSSSTGSSVQATPQRETKRTTSASPGRIPRLDLQAAQSGLPTIVGSPSVSLRPRDDPPKAATPTRIPRAVPNGSTSPAQLSEYASQIDRLSPSSYHGPRKRGTVGPPSSRASSSPDTALSVAPPADASEAEKENRNLSAASTAVPRSRSSGSSNQAVPKVAEQSGLPRASRRTSLLASSRSSIDVNDPSTGMVDGTPFKPSRHSIVGLRTPGKVSTRALSNVSTPATAPTGRRQYVRDATEARASRRLSTQPSVDGMPTTRTAMHSLSNRLTAPMRTAKSSTQSRLTPADSESSRSPSSASRTTPISEEETKADEEMAAYARRQQAKRLAAGASREEMQRMFEFPQPTEPLSGMSSQDARGLYGRSLCEYEKDEILDYDKVWFFGQNAPKKLATKHSSSANYGYDDDRGDYIVIDGDHIRYRYEITGMLGKGSFGQVAQCRDHATGEMVAIKIIRNKKRFHHQALIEIKVLENLRKWDPDEKHHVIKMTEHFSFRGHLCIVTELLSINLYELIKANSFAGFSTVLIRRFTSQVLQALCLLRHHKVVHCDLKPENILLKHPAKSGVQVIDFGSSCFETEKVYTYIQSRFYRSPEVILGMNYHMAIDMWSLGCILAELYTGVPLFPGENEQEQLACIMECLGVPDKYLVDRSSRKKLFFDSTGQPRVVVNSKGKRRRPGSKTLAQVLKCDDELFVDFIAKCLIYDPDRRLKANTALRHPFCKRELRGALPSVATMPISSRAPRLSLTNGVNSLHASSISSPKRKMPVHSGMPSTPSNSSIYSLSGASTAPAQRTRQARSAVVVPQTVQRSAIQT